MNQELLLSKKTTELQYSEVFSYLRNLIKTAFAYEGRMPAGSDHAEQSEELDMQTRVLLEDLKTFYRGLSLDEVDRCFKNGLRNVYGDYYGLNNKTYGQWLAAFSNQKKALLQQQGPSKRLMAGNPEPSEEEKRRISDEQIETARQQVLKDGDLRWFMGVKSLFDNLVNRNRLKEDSWTAYTELARKKIKQDLQDEKRKAHDFREIRSISIRILDLGQTVESTDHIRTEAKRMACENYLRSL